MIRKLPRWVWPAAGFMAIMAGAVNIVGLVSFEHQAVTHLTGTSSLLSQALATKDWHAARLLGVVTAFVAGSFSGGLILPDGVLALGRRHGAALLIEAGLIALAAWLLNSGNFLGVYVISAASGLHNAIGTAYSAAAEPLIQAADAEVGEGVIAINSTRGVAAYIEVARQGRRWEPEPTLWRIG